MDLAAISELNIDSALEAFSLGVPTHAPESPGDVSTRA